MTRVRPQRIQRVRDERMMRRALALAARGRGRTNPNPCVGAVVARGDRIVGEGYHRQAGGPHAEVVALARAGRDASGATLYVTLEPCSHVGRTPPCVDAIRRAGVSRVVAAMVDPNPLVRGKGLAALRRAGVVVDVGLCEPEARALNEAFVAAMERGRPFVRVKIAQSLDGKIATRAGESQWITSAAARREAHRLRAQADAVLVGVNTILRDDPRLTARAAQMARTAGTRQAGAAAESLRGRQPVKVILDSLLKTPAAARVLHRDSPAPVWVVASAAAPAARRRRLERAGATVLTQPRRYGGRRIRWSWLGRELFRRGITHVLIEGGGETIGSAFAERAVDRVHWMIAPRVIGGRTAPTAVDGEGVARLRQAASLVQWRWKRVGPDMMVTADVQWNR